MTIEVLHRRADDTFIVRLSNGLPYHVIASDPLYPIVAAAAEGVDLPPEPEFAPPPPGPRMRRKLDIIARMTDAELEIAETQRALLPLRDRLAWQEAVEVDADDPRLTAFFAGICGFSLARTAELLA